MRHFIILACLLIAGCNQHQSALAPFGVEAAHTRSLMIVMVVAAVVLAGLTAFLYVRAVRAPEDSLDHAGGMRLVLWMGAIVPTILLAALLIYALPAMKPMDSTPADLRIRVEGEQFWWRVMYERNGGAAPIVDANEIRIPVGRTVVFTLTSTDVVHSFWVPGLAGKMDMIPGRDNRLVVKAERPGYYRGVCAEFCGFSHALMAFEIIAMEPAQFDLWLASRNVPVRSAASDAEGARLFTRNGCGACHAIRGTPHSGRIGPDLSRFGERRTLGAGTLEPNLANTSAFIRDPQASKPGTRMPAYAGLSPADADAIATYLKGLK